MLINQESLNSIFTGFKATFKQGFDGAATAWPRIAMKVPSNTRDQVYGWLGQFPKAREWVGPRVINNLMAHGFTVTNRDFEETISVPRNDIQDDQYGIFGPMFAEMGKSAAELPDDLLFTLLASGFTAACYDGQPFFDADHPVSDGETATTASNIQAGAGTPWFLLDCSRAMKPLIYQERMPFNNLVRKDQPNDDNVFFQKEYIYGLDGRANAGFGLWQLAFGSKAELNAENYEAARVAMMSLTGESGRPLGIKPDTLVIPPSLEGAAMRLLNNGTRLVSELDGSPLTNPVAVQNEWAKSAEIITSPWLAA